MKRTAFPTTIAAVASAVVILSAASADAGWPRRYRTHVPSPGCSLAVNHQAVYTTVAVPQPKAMTSSETRPTQQVYYETQPAQGDAYGFTSWINGVRARYGLHALAWSADAAAHAAINSARGFGHSYLGGTRRQNVGVGQLQTVEAMWLQSSAHLSAIVDPSVTEVGIAYVNGVWTMNAR